MYKEVEQERLLPGQHVAVQPDAAVELWEPHTMASPKGNHLMREILCER